MLKVMKELVACVCRAWRCWASHSDVKPGARVKHLDVCLVLSVDQCCSRLRSRCKHKSRFRQRQYRLSPVPRLEPGLADAYFAFEWLDQVSETMTSRIEFRTL
jgi:hypothetical protein